MNVKIEPDVDKQIKAYLQQKGYAEHVVKRGLRGLITGWEETAAGLAQSHSSYIMFYEFLNDVDGRRILRECLEQITKGDLTEILDRLAIADKRFKQATIPITECIWGSEMAVQQGYSPAEDWYYYRRPKVLDNSWPDKFHGDR